MADRADWDKATVQQRHLAVAADAELRRRHPGQHYPPLRSAEPEPATDAQRDDLTLTAGAAARRDAPVDQGPGRRPPHVRRRARRPAEPDGSRPRTPTTATSARRSRPGPDQPRTRSCSRPSPRSRRPRRSSSAPPTVTPTGRPPNDGARVHPGAQEVTAMTATGIPGAGPGGVLRLTWVRDRLAHVLEHCDTDEPSGTWTGLACPDHGLALGADVDTATLRQLSARGRARRPDLGSPRRPDRRTRPAVPGRHPRLSRGPVRGGRAALGQGPGRLVPGLGGEPRRARADPARRPDQVLPGQAAALGGGLLRAPLRPARPPQPARPQHRPFGPNDRASAARSRSRPSPRVR